MKDTCNVTNKSAGHVTYSIPELSVRRSFNARETKKDIPVRELEMLAAQSGGRELIYGYLYIEDNDILEHVINAQAAPEYWLKESDIPSWLNNCSLPEFQDALDFAPEGTKDLIKKYSIEIPLNDYSKRQALKEQLDYDVTKILENIKPEEGEEKQVTPPTRRTNSTTIETPRRRVVVEDKKE